MNSMGAIAECCKCKIGSKFGLKVWVAKPKPRDPAAIVNVDLWQVSIETSPENRSVPRQRVKLEIANIPAYTSELVPLRANYASIAAGSTVLVNPESVHEVLADKVVALPVVYGTGRVRYRDIWDIAWLLTQGALLDPLMV